MDLGFHTTLDDPNSKLDPEVIAISDNITPREADEFGAVWELFTARSEPFRTQDYEVMERTYTLPEVTISGWDNSSNTGLSVSSETIDRITIGDVLLVEGEMVTVKAVDRAENNISVYERGTGATSAAAHSDAVTASIVGNAHIEGKVDPEHMAESTQTNVNYTQLVEELVDLSKADTDQARKTGRTEDQLKAEAMGRITEDLANTAIFGQAVEPTKSKPGQTRGLLSYLTDLNQSLTSNVGGEFTEAALKDGLDAVRTAGGQVTGIVMSIQNKRKFNGFTGADQTQTTRDDRTGGKVLDAFLADGLGRVPAVVDPKMPNDSVALINSNYMEKGWQQNDSLRFVDEPKDNSRQNVQSLQGRFGLAMENVGQTHALLTNISN